MKTSNLVLIAAGLYLGYRLLSKAKADELPPDTLPPIKPDSVVTNTTDITQVYNQYNIQTAQDQPTNPTDPTVQDPIVITPPQVPASLVEDIKNGLVPPPTYIPPARPQPVPVPNNAKNISMPDAPTALKGLNKPVHLAKKTIYINTRTADKTSGKTLVNLFKIHPVHGLMPVAI